MSAEEYKKHLAAGTCFKCGLKFGPTHRCPPKTLNVLVFDEEEGVWDDAAAEESEVVDSEVELRLSELSFNGLDTSQTMKLFGSLNDSKLLVMVDSGASHCFISDRVAKDLQLQVTPTKPYVVRLGDGSRVMAAGICGNIFLKLASEVFVVSCYVFPLQSIDIILGVSWLRSLGDVTANWDNLSMKFPVQGRLVTLQGDPTLSDSTDEDFDVATSLPGQARQQLRDLTAAFPAFLCPTGSPPPSRAASLPQLRRPNPLFYRGRCWGRERWSTTGSRWTRYWSSGRALGSTWQHGWMSLICAGNFLTLALWTRLFRAARQLIRRGEYSSEKVGRSSATE